MKNGLLRKLSDKHERLLTPLLKVKKEADKVYSKGYFENHYPDADKHLKSMLHEKVMAAWSNSLNGNGKKVKEKEVDVHRESPLSISITINLKGS
jgi:hypothetical protein